MRHTVIVAVAGLVIAGSSTVPAASGGRAAQRGVVESEARLIASLNDCIQDRFKDVDEYFGIRRIVTRASPHRFTPESARELTAVGLLERARLRVILYLAGRGVLKPRPDPATTHSFVVRQAIQGPVVVTPTNESATTTMADKGKIAAPESIDLWDESRRAMVAFERVDRHDASFGAWTFTARPVRATERLCLDCHRTDGTHTVRSKVPDAESLRLGDPLGVVWYGRQRIP